MSTCSSLLYNSNEPSAVGLAVTPTDGDSVRIGVRENDWLGKGADVSVRSGKSEGDWLGMREGETVELGVEDDSSVGLGVMSVEIDTEELGEGHVVGLSVGLEVGVAVGDLVGLSVGLRVSVTASGNKNMRTRLLPASAM